MRAALLAAALAAPPTARQAVEDEAFVRALVATRLAPLVAEWRSRATDDATLARRLDLARFEIDSQADPAAERLEAIVAARRALVAQAVESDDPRRAAWALDLASDLLVGWPAIDGRVATLAVGLPPPDAIEGWRAGLDEAEATLEVARTALGETPRGPLALPDARAFRHAFEARLVALQAISAGTRAMLDGRRPEGLPDEVPTGPEWNDLALLSALERGPDRLRDVAGDASRGPWINLAAECAIDLASGDRGRTRLADRAAGLARDRPAALSLLAADAAVRANAEGDRSRFAAWERLLDATPPGRRGATRAAIFPRLQSLPPSGPPRTMGDLELAIRSMSEPFPEDLAAEIDARPARIEGMREAPRLLAFARLRRLAVRGELDGVAALAESLSTDLGDDPIASAAAEMLVQARAAIASASTSAVAARAEREALALAIDRFPNHPQRHRWAIDLALARLRSDDPAAAVDAVRAVPDAVPSGREARAVEAFALVRTGDARNLARAESIVRDFAGDGATVAARTALVQALLLARSGRSAEARASADAVVADPTLPAPVRADALAVALELGATLPPQAAHDIMAAQPRARGPLLAALPGAARDSRRLKMLLAALEGSLDRLDPDERLAVAEANLAAGTATAAASLAADVIATAPPGSATSLAATLVRARALRATGGDAQIAEAFTLARDVARQAPQASPAWWEANALQLEILEASGRNRDQVLPWINRLKSVDPALGGAEVQVRIEAVAARVGPR